MSDISRGSLSESPAKLDVTTERIISAYGYSIEKYVTAQDSESEEDIAALWGATSDTRDALRQRIRELCEEAETKGRDAVNDEWKRLGT